MILKIFQLQLNNIQRIIRIKKNFDVHGTRK